MDNETEVAKNVVSKAAEGVGVKVVRKLGRPPLKEKKQSLTLRLPTAHILEFKGYCAKNGNTCSKVIDTLIVEYLKINGVEIS